MKKSSFSYEIMIALRHLQGSQRNTVISVLTLISLVGVLVGVWALTVVLSVLSGFSGDLRSKIIRSSPDIIIDRYAGDFVQSSRVCRKVLKIKGVTGCSPFILNEVMVVNNDTTNTAGVLLRGISKGNKRIRTLLKQMKKGKLEHLFDPASIVTSLNKQSLLKKKRRMLKGLSDEEKRWLKLAPPPPWQQGSGKGDAADAATDTKKPVARKKKAPAPRKVAKKKADPDEDDFNFLKPKTRKQRAIPGILMGKELAGNLSLKVGSTVRVISPLGGSLTPMGPAPRIRKFRVAGLFQTGMYEYDTKFAFITLSSIRKLFRMPDSVTGVEVKVKDIYQTPGIKRDILRRIGGGPYRVRDWIEMNARLFGALRMEKIAMFVILAFIILVASFNIVSTLFMVVVEKAQEIAILKSMGAQRGSIMRILMLQGMVVGVIGTVIGLLLGWRTCLFLINHPIRMNTDVYYIATLPVKMNVTDFFAVAVAAIVLSFLATVYPAMKAAELDPVEGLQHE